MRQVRLFDKTIDHHHTHRGTRLQPLLRHDHPRQNKTAPRIGLFQNMRRAVKLGQTDVPMAKPRSKRRIGIRQLRKGAVDTRIADIYRQIGHSRRLLHRRHQRRRRTRGHRRQRRDVTRRHLTGRPRL